MAKLLLILLMEANGCFGSGAAILTRLVLAAGVVHLGNQPTKDPLELRAKICIALDERTIVRGQQQSPGILNSNLFVLKIVGGLNQEPDLQQVLRQL